ncbi:MAG: hypothetical protein AAGE93_01245 [Bacteroidota bacterium]
MPSENQAFLQRIDDLITDTMSVIGRICSELNILLQMVGHKKARSAG